MTIQEIRQKTDIITTFLSKRQLKNAFEEIRTIASEMGDWNIMAELENIETTYKYMLQYMLSGADDPEREKVYGNLLKSTYGLADKLSYLLQEKFHHRYYFQNKRALPVDQRSGCVGLAHSLQEIAAKISLSDLLEEADSGTSIELQKEQERQADALFKCIWLNQDLNREEQKALSVALQDKAIPFHYRALLISALLLSLKEFFDEEKILLLIDAYELEEEELRQRALVALILVLYTYDSRLHVYPSIQNRLYHLTEDPEFIKNVNTIIKQFILTKETEKITKKINEELLPEMMKISPKISQKINLAELMDVDSTDEKNPEWKNILEEMGLNDKLQEMNELQMEGADVMHSSFSNLKIFPFFYDLGNWFLPFYPRHSSLVSQDKAEGILEALVDLNYICNSDKYSLCFSLQQMPGQYRGMVLKQMLSETAEFLKQQKETELLPQNKVREGISNQYIHDLYRFYKIFPRKTEFEDVFATPLSFYQTKTIGSIISDEKSLLSIGEYYFSKNQYEDAKNIFERLTGKGLDDAVLFQKIAYCKQMKGDIEGALEDYLKSELMQANNSWTLRKIASCYRMQKQPQKALEYYRKVEVLNPDNLSVQLNIGHCYLELKEYQEALKTYFKVEYLNSNSHKSWRPIAWCSFLTGKFEQAVNYYEKILSHQAEMSDYLNYGHALLAMKDIKGAIEQYKTSATLQESSKEKFSEAFNADIPELVQAGIPENDLAIVLDQVLYSIGKA